MGQLLALAAPSSSASDQVIENNYQSIKNAVSADDPLTFSEDEVEVAISSIKRNKAAGVDNINSEHILYGGSLLVSHLSWLFDAILASSYVPKAFKVGLIIPIPKGRNKDLSNPSNYRGITILSNLSKLCEKLILAELRVQDSPPSLNPLQGGFRPGYSCSHCAFI